MQEQLFVTPKNKAASGTDSRTSADEADKADRATRRMEWELDERTKEIGRRGLARARAAMRSESDDTEVPAAA